MILADKIVENRKKCGWSQEELADKLGVSRQSVSKWESAQAVPDMKKIVQMSKVFGVSTDYLLRDDIETASESDITPIDSGLEESVRSVSLEEANEFLEHNERAAVLISTGVMMCILSPVLLLILGGLAAAQRISVGEEAAYMIGVAALLLIVASAVAIFIIFGLKGQRFDYLEKQNIDTDYGVSGMVKECKSNYAGAHARLLVLGIVLCIISSVPLFILLAIRSTMSNLIDSLGVALILILIAIGVKMIVLTSIRQGGFDKLLEEGDYTRLNKKAGVWDGIYWAIATAVYLGWSFITMDWQMTWIVWPIAGVVFAAYKEVMRMIVRSKNA